MAPVVLSLAVTAVAVFVLHRSRRAMWFVIAAGWLTGIWITAYNLSDPASQNLPLPSAPRPPQLLGFSRVYWLQVFILLGVVSGGFFHGAMTRYWKHGLRIGGVLLIWVGGLALATYVGFRR